MVTADEAASDGWENWLQALAAARRATLLSSPGHANWRVWVAAEKLPLWHAIHADAAMQPAIEAPAEFLAQAWSREDALLEMVRGRLVGLGPVTVATLAASLAVDDGEVETALLRLQSEGYVMQGLFTPAASATQWCERHLLARIHRYTIGRLRREIEPVSRRDFMRFQFDWHHLAPGSRLSGPDALPAAIAQLEGYEAAAGAWEAELLPARIDDYSITWLDDLCRAGRVGWNRLRGATGGSSPVRATPIVLLPRKEMALWSGIAGSAQPQELLLSSRAQAVADVLREHGALFFDELMSAAHLLRTELEDALGELVAAGRVTADSFAGLRALLLPAAKRDAHRHRRMRRHLLSGIEDAGRWSLVRAPLAPDSKDSKRAEAVEHVARTLLRRYGVVFWKLLEREAGWLPTWRELLRVYHRLEARGEIRGGRFVEGLVGEQFALPEAIGKLRQIRQQPPENQYVCLSGCDPLNLVGTVLSGNRLPAVIGTRVLYEDGVAVAALVANKPQWLAEADSAAQQRWKSALLRRAEHDAASVHF